MSSRGKIKRHREEERRRQEQIVIAYYKKNPALFFERELGVKLSRWQKILLRIVRKGIK